MKKILITGANGQVGWELQSEFSFTPAQIFAFDRSTLDLANPDAIRNVIREVKPNIILNAGAYTAVDLAEKEQDLAMAINGNAPGILAEEAKKINALLVHYSTDYVFDGSSSHPYKEVDATNPLNAYGKSKLAGEQAIQAVDCHHYIFRTSWVYGNRGKNFLLTMLKLGAERDQLKIVEDQIGAPTWCHAIAETTKVILQGKHDAWGLYNLTNQGSTSWLGFATAIFKQASLTRPGFVPPVLSGIPSSAYPTPAKRPHNSRLCPNKFQKTFGLMLPNWDHALNQCLMR